MVKDQNARSGPREGRRAEGRKDRRVEAKMEGDKLFWILAIVAGAHVIIWVLEWVGIRKKGCD
jgi:hypothetical protein